MIDWLWLIPAFFAGFGGMALFGMSTNSDLEGDNMRLRERLAGCEQMNDQMRRLAELNSKGAADATELQEE